ncbi:MAG: hypothetical protein RIC33_02145 [Gimesia maris]|tara:strand:- start:15271 stop:15399 length:129 start_codon:yes stop_codon:yes gene_type:complete
MYDHPVNDRGPGFFVRHTFFLGANDPYKSLKSTFKPEINAEA